MTFAGTTQRLTIGLILLLVVGMLSVRAQAEDPPSIAPASGQLSPVTLTANAPTIALNGHLAQYLDDSKQRDIAAIRQLPATAFRPLPGSANVGYRDTVLWLRITLQRSADAPAIWWLVVGPAYLDRVSLFPALAGQEPVREIAPARNWSQRELPARHVIFALDLGSQPQQTFFLRVENATALQASPVLWQPQAYLPHSVRTALLHGGALMTALVIVLINLFYWFSLRQPIFLWYITFVGSTALTLMQIEGYLLLLLQPEAPFPDKILLALSQLAAALSFYGLFAAFVKPQRYWPGSCRLAGGLTGTVLVSVMLLLLLGQTGTAVQIEWGYVLCLFVVSMTGSCLMALRRDLRAIRYLLCFSVLILLIILHALRLFGLVDFPFDFSTLFVVACLIHWVLLQLVIVDDIKTLRRQHEAARDAALAKALAMEQELEQRVEQRTAELERVEQQLRRALEDEKETNVAHHQFLRLVSHEFMTPLSVMAGSAEMLSDRGDDPELRERVVRRIENATAKMNALVERALQIDRNEGAVWRANAQEVRLDNLIAQVVQSCQSVEPGPDRIAVACPALELRVDPELLAIALQNLLLNALKYSPPQAPVAIRVEQDSDGLRIHVRDQGDGIPPSRQQAIFGKYYRHHDGHPGLGLGLYLVDLIMRLHGGRVTLVSTPGTGSCFTLHLPLHSDLPRG
ncbi:MAG: sensor histidine kinase [Desulfuromonadaceae bacterium]|nr:sensor histidine kinase [Desulfuromonadaceae bacterium]